MSMEAARDLSIPDLLRVLNEKLRLDCTRIQGFPAVSTDSLGSEVGESRSAHLNGSDSAA